MAAAKKKRKISPDRMPKTAEEAKMQVVQTVLTWSHVIAISIITLAFLCNIGGFIAMIYDNDIAKDVTEFAKAWQGFFIAGVLGYDAKSGVENVLKIRNKLKEYTELKAGEGEEDGTEDDGESTDDVGSDEAVG